MSTETAELVRRASRGDDEAFRRLVRDVHPVLRRWALARTGDPDDADEVVQRALIRMHRSLDDFEGRGRLTTWLYRVVANAATDLERSRAARPTEPESAARRMATPDGPHPVQALHARRMAGALGDYLEALPPRQREVLELVDHQGMRPAEAAELLDMKPVSVRASLFKGRRALRKAMLTRYPELAEGYER